MSNTRRVYDKTKTYYCKCGCGRAIDLKPYHKSYGVPDYVESGHSRKGKECSDDHKKKLSEQRKVTLKDPKVYDKIFGALRERMKDEDVRDSIRQSKIGSTLPQEVRDKISKTKLANDPTKKEIKARKECAERLVKYNQENDPWNKGKKQSQEVIDNRVSKLKGQKRTKEVRELMSELAIQRCIDETDFSRGKYFSNKNNCFIKYDSSYEVRAYELLEELDTVVSYRRCNFYIKYFYEGINRSTNPDLLLNYADGTTEMVEVKPCRFIINCDKTIKKINVAHQYCKERGIKYSVWTEKKLFKSINYNTWKRQKTL